MRRHAGVVTGAAIAAVGLLLALAAFAGFSLGLPAVQPATALSPSWFMIAVVLIFTGAVVALAARGLELEAEEHTPVRAATPVRPVVHLHLVRR
jgi:TRAP-type C4-dicarboxylate transport system permease small subunit